MDTRQIPGNSKRYVASPQRIEHLICLRRLFLFCVAQVDSWISLAGHSASKGRSSLATIKSYRFTQLLETIFAISHEQAAFSWDAVPLECRTIG